MNQLRKGVFAIALAVAMSTITSADVTLTFDSDLDGFILGNGNVAVAHSTDFGGTMRIQATEVLPNDASTSGFFSTASRYDFNTAGSNAAFDAEFAAALANGGTLSYDVTFNEADIDFETSATGGNPGWFESSAVADGNSTTFNTENFQFSPSYDVNNPGVITGTVTQNIIAGPTPSPSDSFDGDIYWDPASSSNRLQLGLNWDPVRVEPDAGVRTAVGFFDNVTISANVVPEPTSFGLVLLVGMGLVSKRRR